MQIYLHDNSPKWDCWPQTINYCICDFDGISSPPWSIQLAIHESAPEYVILKYSFSSFFINIS